MKPYYTVALSMLVGAGLGGAAIQALARGHAAKASRRASLG